MSVSANRSRHRPDRGLRALLAALLLALPALAAAAVVRIAWIEERPADTLLSTSGLVAFHDGGLDVFDHDRPPTPLLERIVTALISGGVYSTQEALADEYPQMVFQSFFGRPYEHGAFSPTPPNFPRFSVVLRHLDPQRHQYLSFLVPLQPSNDAFAGNEDPLRYRLFDDDGRFLGPFQIEIYGSDVLDAGLCDNTEAELIWLDRSYYGPDQLCTGGEGLVRHHPGLNGSVRNPDGVPVRVLGGTSTFSPTRIHHYDEVAADFSRPGQLLGRLLVSVPTGWAGPTGSWYSPERAGEGFSLQILPPVAGSDQARAIVYWYTYAPDGSGRQLWLTGTGTLGGNLRPQLSVFLHATRGGRFASTSNPGTVEPEPWGLVQFEFQGCDRATATYAGNDPAFGSGGFGIHRLGPPVQGLDWLCSPADPFYPAGPPP